MKQKFLVVLIPVVCMMILATVGILLNVQNNRLMKKNQQLLLENDSILSVNLELSKYSERLQCQLDSAGLAGR